MSDRRRRLIRHYLVVGLSLLAHGAVLGWLAYSASINPFGAEPPPPPLSVELVRPERSGSRPMRSASSPPSTVPMRHPWRGAPGADVLSFPVLPSTASGPPGNPSPASADVVAPGQLQGALRAGTGCIGPATQTHSREEREKCLERLGRLSASAPAYDAPIDPAKRAYFDEVAAAGPSGAVSQEATPGAVTPGSAHVTIFKCSVLFGVGQKPKDRQGTVRLGGTPCTVPLQGSFFTPEATVRKR